jgi:DNA polymerase (family 10)
VSKAATKISLAEATKIAKALAKALKPHTTRIEFTGSLRRKAAKVGDLDVVVLSDKPACDVLEAAGAELYERGTKRAGGTFQGLQVNLWRSTPESWGSSLFRTTGPKGYVIGYCTRARKMGLKLCDEGVFRGDERIAGETEEDVYEALDKPYKAPEARGR